MITPPSVRGTKALPAYGDQAEQDQSRFDPDTFPKAPPGRRPQRAKRFKRPRPPFSLGEPVRVKGRSPPGFQLLRRGPSFLFLLSLATDQGGDGHRRTNRLDALIQSRRSPFSKERRRQWRINFSRKTHHPSLQHSPERWKKSCLEAVDAVTWKYYFRERRHSGVSFSRPLFLAGRFRSEGALRPDSRPEGTEAAPVDHGSDAE